VAAVCFCFCAGSCSGGCLLHTWALAGGLRLQEGGRQGAAGPACRGARRKDRGGAQGRGDAAALFLQCWAHRGCMAVAVQGRLAGGAHGQGEGLARLVQQLLLAAPKGRGGLGWAWRRRRTG
jgi:hypothetical protein